MDALAGQVADVAQHFLTANARLEISAALQASSHFQAFFQDPLCTFVTLCEAEPRAEDNAVATTAGGISLTVSDSLFSLTASMKVYTCIALMKPHQAAGAGESIGEDSPDEPSSPIAAGPITLKDVHFRTVKFGTSAYDTLLSELSEVYDPLCRQSGRAGATNLVSSQITELVSAIKSQRSTLPDFKVTRYIHPEVQALCAANSEASIGQLVELLGDKSTDNKLVNEAQGLRGKCMAEIDVDIFGRPVTTIRDELAYWQNLDRWIDDVKSQLMTREWQFTVTKLLLRRIGQIVDKLPQQQRTAQEILHYLNEIPYQLISTSSEDSLAANCHSVFNKMGEFNNKYPSSRALELANAVVADVTAKICEFASLKDIFALPPASVRAWLRQHTEAIQETENGLQTLTDFHRRHVASQSNQRGINTDLRNSNERKMLNRLSQRFQEIQTFVEAHSGFFIAVRDFGLDEVEHFAEELHAAYGAVGVAAGTMWDFSPQAEAQYREAVASYDKHVAVVEQRIATILWEKIEGVSTGNEMYRIHEMFSRLRNRPKIRQAIGEYQHRLVKLIDEGIATTKARFFDKNLKREATRISRSRGSTELSADVTYDVSVLRTLDEQLRKRDLVSELGFHELLLLRLSDKRWQLDDALAQFMGVSLESLQKGAKNTKIPGPAYGSAFAVAFLGIIFKESEQHWSGAVQQAKKAVTQADRTINLDDLVREAQQHLENVGVGQRHVINRQAAAEYSKLKGKISLDISTKVGTWAKTVREVMVSMPAYDTKTTIKQLRGPIFEVRTVKNKPTLSVTYPPELTRLIQDQRELVNLRVYPDTGVDDITAFLNAADRVHNTAVSLIDMVNTYYESIHVANADTILLEDANRELNQQFLEGANQKWDQEQLSRTYARSLCQSMQSFTHRMKDVRTVTSAATDLCDLMRRCRVNELPSLMDELQKKMNDLMIVSPNYIPYWFEQFKPSVDKVLQRHLLNVLKNWEDEFVLLNRQERDLATQLTEEGVETRGLIRHYNLEPLKVTLRVTPQGTKIEPSLTVCRRFWIAQLNDALDKIVALPPLQHDNQVRSSVVGCHYLIDALPSGKFASVLGTVEAIFSKVTKLVSNWDRHQSLWSMELSSIVRLLGDDLEKWTQLVEEVRGSARNMMDTTEKVIECGGICIDQEEAQRSIADKYRVMSEELFGVFKTQIGKQMTAFYATAVETRERLERYNVQHSVEHAIEYLCWLPELTRELAEWEITTAHYLKGQSLLDSQRFIEFPTEWIFAGRIVSEFESIKALVERKTEVVEGKKVELHGYVEDRFKQLRGDVEACDTEFRDAGLDRGNIKPPVAVAEIGKFHARSEQLWETAKNLAQAQEALQVEVIQIRALEALHADVVGLKEVWVSVNTMNNELEDVGGKMFVEIVPRQLQRDLQELERKVDDFPSSMRSYAAHAAMKDRIKRFLSMHLIITDLRSDAMAHERHWISLQTKLKKTRFVLSDVTLNAVWDADPVANAEIFKGVVRNAQGEQALENFIGTVKKHWEEYLLDTISFKGKVNLLRGWDLLFEKLAEHLGSLASMKMSPYYREFEASANDWDDKLNRIRCVLECLVEVQRRWVYLDGIFSGSADIRRQLPGESGQFDKASKEFFMAMPRPKAGTDLTVIRFCMGDKLLQTFERISRELAGIQRALGDYLESQRATFPRFYFVGDEDLLEVIGNGKAPLLVAKHLKKMFAGLSGITVSGENDTVIEGMVSAETEIVLFGAGFDTADKKVNDWLVELQNRMVSVLRSSVGGALTSYPSSLGDFQGWIKKYCNQVATLVVQVHWAAAMEKAINTSPEAVLEVAAGMSKLLDQLAEDVLLSSGDAIQRQKTEQVITVAVYQRDVARTISASKITTSQDFDWLSTMRCVHDPAGGEGGSVQCTMANANFDYSYEYLGLAERLVQTPLTDKCFLTLTQALHTKLGGAPSGPAGTGKTETVKALGLQLGRFVLVFCCDENFDFKSMGRIFVGLCQVGAWGCFDEFNRLQERILSAVSQQIQSIQEGLKRDNREIEIVDRKLKLHGDVGIFITMNPGYAGRSNLPDNLKQLFRGVMMTAPDRQVIAEVMLFAQGFLTAERLAKKIVPLFRLCKDQLSQQSHYDFGLRALKSVLICAGSMKRKKTQASADNKQLSAEDESDLVLQSVTETMVPKLVAGDVKLLHALLGDVFPGYKPKEPEHDRLKQAILVHCARHSYVPSEAWLSKIFQLYQILQVNHGVMLVGPSGCGKTTAWTTLLNALADVEDVDGHAYVLDPKAMTKNELYGFLDPTTREWKDGAFTSILRKIVENIKGDDQSKKRHWIMFDGDVDPEWVENLNALLDDNKLLTLPNGERLNLPPNVRVVFEVSDLKYATLATVSRCGMVWFSENTMQVHDVLAQQLGQLKNRPCTMNEEPPLTFAERATTLAAKATKDATEFTFEQQQLLQFQARAVDLIAEAFVPGGFVEEALRIATDKYLSFAIMEQNRAQSIRALFTLLSQAIGTLHNQGGEGAGGLPTVESMSDETLKNILTKRLMVSVLWGFTCGCSIDKRNEYAKELKYVEGPKGGALLDFDVNAETGKWQDWRERIPATDVNGDKVGFGDTVISTIDTVRHEYVISNWLRSGKPVILCGPPGSGKTMSLTAVLNASPEYEAAFLNFSSSTQPEAVLKTLDQYCTTRSTLNGLVTSPISGKKLIIFCDECNLAQADKYGTQRVVQLLRQLTERNGYYRAKDNTWITLDKVQFVGACNPPTDPGRVPLTHRFLRWAPVLYVDYPSEESMKLIYSTYLSAMLKRNNQLHQVASKTASAMVTFYKANQHRFTSDIQRHYVYSPRELSRWCRAIYTGFHSDKSDPNAIRNATVEDLIRLAAHEGLRLFQDRLTTASEQEETDKMIDAAFGAEFQGYNVEAALQRPLLFSTMTTAAYSSVTTESLRKEIQGKLKTFADEELDVQLVVFDAVLDHVVRIDRVLQQPLGHMLLVGSSGVGKTVLSKFVAWKNGLEVFQIKAHRGYTLEDFEDDLRSVMRSAGLKCKPVCFIFDESNIMDSGFLEYMNALLASGDVPGLFEGEEWSRLMHQIKDAITAQKALQKGSSSTGSGVEFVDETIESELYKWFISQVARYLHVVFTMNPQSPDFHNRTGTSPALFNRCTIDWFGDWSPETITQVAVELTRKVDVMAACPGQFSDSDDAQGAVSTAMCRMHQAVCEENEAARRQAAGRGTFITPRHFLDFIHQFHVLYKEKRSAVQDLQRHLNTGLNKLKETSTDVDKQQLMLAEKEKILEESGRRGKLLLEQIVEDSRAAEGAKKEASVLAVELAKETAIIEAKQAEAEVDLAEARPALDAAAEALTTVKAEYLREIRAYKTPPVMVKKVLECVAIIMGEKKTDWDAIKGLIQRDDFIINVKKFKPDDIKPEVRALVMKNYLSDETFTYEQAMRSSKAAGPLQKWASAMVRFADINLRIAPLRESIAILTEETEGKRAALKAAQDIVDASELKMQTLKDDYATCTAENTAIKTEIEVVARRCGRATMLVRNLLSEKERWEGQSASFQTQITNVLGDCLVSSAFLAYIGYFDEYYRRQRIMPEWSSIIETSQLLHRKDLSITEYLSTPEQRQSWASHKLPADSLCIENAIMLERFERYPLIIDPSGQAIDFVLNKMKDKKVARTSFLQKSFLKDLEMGIRFGHPVLIQDVENVDPVLNPLLNKEIKRTGGRPTIRLGASDIDVSPTFTLLLTSRDSSFQFAPDLCGRVTMINFTVTPSSLQSQCMHQLLHHERPDVEVMRSDLTKIQGEFKFRLRVLEQELLTALSDAEGNILENDSLLQTLETLKKESGEIEAKVAESEHAFLEIKGVEAQYTPVAAATSATFFGLEQLQELNFMYRFSLQFLFDIVKAALETVPTDKSPTERLPILTRNIFHLLTSRVTRSMFQVDHLSFVLRVAQIRCQVGDPIAKQLLSEDWETLLGAAKTGGNSTVELPGGLPEHLPPASRSMLRTLLSNAAYGGLGASLNSPEDKDKWSAFFSAPDPATVFPEQSLPRGTPNARKMLQKALVIKALRPDAFTSAVEDFLCAFFDTNEHGTPLIAETEPAFFSTSAQAAFGDVLLELTPFTPLLLVSSAGFDASPKVEVAAMESGKSMQTVAMGSPEGFDDANKYVNQAMQYGGWVLLKNVHLASSFLSTLEKWLHQKHLEGGMHDTFRLFLSSEVSDKIPVNLITCSRVMVFEPPPGIKSNLRRTLGAMQNVPSSPQELPRLYFIAAWLHAVVMERQRYLPLGWSKRLEFGAADFDRVVGTINSWVQLSVAKGQQHIKPDQVPWTALHKLVTETVYGGRIDNQFDQTLLTAFCDTFLSAKVFDSNFSLVSAGSEPLRCDGVTLADFKGWINKLPEIQPPEWLGLPASATGMVRITQADDTIVRWNKLQNIFADSAATSTGSKGSDDSGGAAAWMVRLAEPVTQWLALLAKTPFTPKNWAAEHQHHPLILALSRERDVGQRLLSKAVRELEEVLACCKGTKKPTNNIRDLISHFSKDSVPSSWRSTYSVPPTINLSAWMGDFAGRLEKLSTLVGLSPAEVQQKPIHLGWLFSPEAFLTATRQTVARSKTWPLEQLVMRVCMYNANTPPPPADECDFSIMGVTAQSASVNGSGQLEPLVGDSAVSTQISSVVLSWALESDVAAAAASSQVKQLNLPLYLNPVRLDVLATVPVAVSSAVPVPEWYHKGVCLTAWGMIVSE